MLIAVQVVQLILGLTPVMSESESWELIRPSEFKASLRIACQYLEVRINLIHLGNRYQIFISKIRDSAQLDSER